MGHDAAFIREWTNPEAFALSLGLACFTLPFLVFAAPAGFLADRFSKRNVMIACKAAELVVIGLGITAILIGNVPLMFLMLFVLGGQAMMFITSKLGSIPEIVHSDKISAANGLINMVSMAAMISAAGAGGWLYERTMPAGQERWWLYAAALLGVASCGLIASLFIGRLPAANPQRAIPWNPAGQTVHDLGKLMSQRSLFLAALGSAYFWGLAAMSQVNIDQFATKHLCVTQQYVGPLLAALTLGIGGGALLAGGVSRGKVELGLVPLGGFGIALMSVLLTLAPGGVAGTFTLSSYAISCRSSAGHGRDCGLVRHPLAGVYSRTQPARIRGSVMAAYNFLAFAGMLAASGVYWLLSGPLGLSSRAIFLVGGLVTVPITLWIVRLLPFQTTRFLVWLLSRCVYRVTDRRTGTCPGTRWRPAGRQSRELGRWRLARSGLSAASPHGRLRPLLRQPLAGLVWPARPHHPARDNAQVDGRIDPLGPRGFTKRGIRVYLSRRRNYPQRGNAGISARIPLDLERNGCSRSSRPTWGGCGEASSATRGGSSFGSGRNAGDIPY